MWAVPVGGRPLCSLHGGEPPASSYAAHDHRAGCVDLHHPPEVIESVLDRTVRRGVVGLRTVTDDIS